MTGQKRVAVAKSRNKGESKLAADGGPAARAGALLSTAAAAGARAKGRSTIAMLILTPALLALLFPPFYCYLLAPFALVPLALCVVRRPMRWRYAGLYYLSGVAFFLPNLYWIGPVTWLGYVLLALFCALYFPVFAFGLHRLVNGLRVPAMIAVPVLWTAIEYLRGTLVQGGFPWFLLGNSLAPRPLFIQIADLAGVWGVSFFIAMLNGLFVDLLRLPLFKDRRFNPTLGRMIATAVVVTAFVIIYGMFRLRRNTLTIGPRVAVIQDDIPQRLDNQMPSDEIFARYEKLARQAAQALPKPDLVAWPETMADGPLNPEFLHMPPSHLSEAGLEVLHNSLKADSTLRQLTDSTGACMLVGSSGLSFDENTHLPQRQNITLLYLPGEGQSPDYYAKVHLVPFGEYIPFRGLPLIGKYMVYIADVHSKDSSIPIDYSNTPGTRWTRFQLPATQVAEVPGSAPATGNAATAPAPAAIVRNTRFYTFATPICFEDTMPEPDRQMTAPQFAGGKGGRKTDFLVNVSNDGWFDQTLLFGLFDCRVELDQHLQACQFRAVENRVPIARAVNTGNSGFIDSCGRIVKLVTGPNGRSPGASGTAAQTLMLDSRITLFSQIGDLLPILCGIAAVLGIGWTFVRPRRSPRPN